MTDSKTHGKLVVISGPSGVGKSTICKRVVEQLDAFLSVSATTRPQSELEQDGRDYIFLSRDDFQAKIREGEFLEYADVFGHYYGTPKTTVDAALADGRMAILEIDIQGGLQVKRVRPEAVMIFILPPHKKDLEKRMQDRGRGEDAAAKQRRLETAGREIAAAWQHYDHMVINDDLDHAVREVVDIIQGNLTG
jgi:guanylate kinase